MIDLTPLDATALANGSVALIGAAVLAAFIIFKAAAGHLARSFVLRRSRSHVPNRRPHAHGFLAGSPEYDGGGVVQARGGTTHSLMSGGRGGGWIRLMPPRDGGALMIGQPQRRDIAGDNELVEDRLFGDLKRCASGRAIAAVFEEPRYRRSFSRCIMDQILTCLMNAHASREDVVRVLMACQLDPYANGRERRVFLYLIPGNEPSETQWRHPAETWIGFQRLGPSLGGLNTMSPDHQYRFLVYFTAADTLAGWETLRIKTKGSSS